MRRAGQITEYALSVAQRAKFETRGFLVLRELRAVTVEYGPGDVTIHHGRTLHYTSGNPRRGLSIHLWPEPN